MRVPWLSPMLALLASFALSSAASAQDTPPPADSAAPKANVDLLPVLGSAPETGFQYGVAVFATKAHRVAGTRTSSLVSNAIHTVKGQTRAFVELDRWTAHNDWRFSGTFIWQQYPLPFFGVGDATEEGDKEAYTPRGTDIFGTVQRRIGPKRWVVAHARRIENEMRRTAPGGLLEPGTVLGSRGGRTVLASVGLVTDTRDNIFAPSRGAYGEVMIANANSALGSNFDFSRIRFDARGYLRVGGGHVLAAQATAQGIFGDAPFDQLSNVGSSTVMRGYLPGRFRDDWMAATQVEARSALWNQMGAALFVGAGAVAPAAGDLFSARVLPTVGGGFRYRLDPRTGATVRIDYARGTKGQSGLYVSFSEAF